MPSILSGPVSRWLDTPSRRGDSLLASHMDQIRDALRRGRIAVAAPLELRETPAGLLIRLAAWLASVTVAKSGAAGIPALSGSTPGKATDVTLYSFDGTNLTSGQQTTAFNLATNAVAANKWLILLTITGYNFVIFEDC